MPSLDWTVTGKQPKSTGLLGTLGTKDFCQCFQPKTNPNKITGNLVKLLNIKQISNRKLIWILV